MAKSGGSGGRGSGSNGGPMMAANATGGRDRVIGGVKYNTADVVNESLSSTTRGQLDLDKSRDLLGLMGHKNPAPGLVQDHAFQTVVLNKIGRITGNPAISNQVGKWDFSSAQTIHSSFNSYLDRRIAGQHARWTENTRG